MSTRHAPKSPAGKPDRLKPPPNYFSRGVQMRLMIMVATLMLVMVLMFEARNPDNWLWMGFPDDAEDREVDTRVPAAAGGQDESRSDDEGAAARIPDLGDFGERLSDTNQSTDPGGNGSEESPDGQAPESKPPWQLTDEDGPDRLLALARLDFWRNFYTKLDPDHRAFLFKAVRTGRFQQSIEAQHGGKLTDLINTVTVRRESYHTNLLRSISGLPLDENVKRDLWTEVLIGLQGRWTRMLPALRSIEPEADDGSADQSRQRLATFNDLQRVLDAIALDMIEDDALASRLDERESWYRMFERVEEIALAERNLDEVAVQGGPDSGPAATSPARIEPAAEVSFLQLFEQPDSFRGQRVTFSGYVHRVERKRAAPNEQGIELYHVFWVRPTGKANAPIAVYALRRPDGFPEYDDQGKVDFDGGPSQPVTIDGLFFKRWGYQAQDGVRLCPLIVAWQPTWTPVTVEPAARFEMPGWTVTLIVLAALGIVAASISWWAYRASSRSRFRGFQVGGGVEPQRLPDQLVTQLAQSPSDRLKFPASDGNTEANH